MLRRQSHSVLPTVAIILATSLAATSANAYLPLATPDYLIATRADLVVVGRIKDGTVEYLPVVEELSNGQTINWCAPRARFLVAEVADGKLREREIAIWFRGGVLPLVEGQFDWGTWHIDLRREHFDPDSIQIGTLNNSFYLRDRLKDLRKNHLWFLKRNAGFPGLQPNEEAWCIDSWDDVSPLNLKDYFMAYRAADPKKALLAVESKYPESTETIRRYVASLDAVDYSQTADPRRRARKLVRSLQRDLKGVRGDVWLDHTPAAMVRNGLIGCGDAGAEALAKELDLDSAKPEIRRRMIEVLGDIRSPIAKSYLLRILETNLGSWKELKPESLLEPDLVPGRASELYLEIQTISNAIKKQAD